MHYKKVISFVLLPYLLFSHKFVYGTISIQDIDTAKEIGTRISAVPAGNRTKIDCLVDNIINDHSIRKHYGGRSYFNTEDRDQIKEISRFIINNATDYKVYPVVDRFNRDRRRLALKVNFNSQDSNNIINSNWIGTSSPSDSINPNKNTNWAVICFDITGIDNINDIPPKGATITAYPAEQLSQENQF